MVRTDYILFIAAGAFHVAKPSDLIPELQGRFPIRVELEPLGRDDFVRILTEPRSALVKQYAALLATEGVTSTFTPDAVERIADFAGLVNERTENIGARRLHTVMERLLDEISFDAAERAEHHASPSTRRTSSACSPTSSRTTTFPGTSCDGSPPFAASRRSASCRGRGLLALAPRRVRQEGAAARAAAHRARAHRGV